MLSVELNGGVPDSWLSAAEAPGSAPDVVRETLWEGPDTRARFSVKLALPPGTMLCCVGVAVIEKSDCAGCPTVKVLPIALLLLSGSRPSGMVETIQVRVCVPGVAIHGICVLTM